MALGRREERREGKAEDTKIPGTILEESSWRGLESPVNVVNVEMVERGKDLFTARVVVGVLMFKCGGDGGDGGNGGNGGKCGDSVMSCAQVILPKLSQLTFCKLSLCNSKSVQWQSTLHNTLPILELYNS